MRVCRIITCKSCNDGGGESNLKNLETPRKYKGELNIWIKGILKVVMDMGLGLDPGLGPVLGSRLERRMFG